MKSSFVICFVAALAFVAANVQAQDTVAQAVDASQTTVQPTGDCQDCCEPGLGIGGRFGGLRGGFGGFGAGSWRARYDQYMAERADRLGRERQIVQASPFAYPTGEAQDWARFRNYPYGYYPHNFAPSDMRIPGYNPAWQNYYPAARRYHQGQHFNLDVF
ncbi:MAG: hypothetical protein II561_06545 [Thermoguttaceae bacterium]|nr:hypothetical protein [Thermoguttaceae bacterium]MBQ1863613.1 hypothetical protein [Thermoguttaceae bacterium]MBQ2039297.1 hypothetical protein [Thermoguttaceae bacterium]MBQ2556195.1 hypothetical protein [Thermoguttaceae bacterium]MBQ3822858.1 hypothetical protein [Thermoguttaceae bacterium]